MIFLLTDGLSRGIKNEIILYAPISCGKMEKGRSLIILNKDPALQLSLVPILAGLKDWPFSLF